MIAARGIMAPDELGRRAEDQAAAYLNSLGWRVRGRNLSNRYGELDIVALDGDELVVVEVRCRTVGVMQPPEATVGPRKLRTLVRAGRAMVEGTGWPGPWRIDLIAITVDLRGTDPDAWRLSHIRDITAGMDV